MSLSMIVLSSCSYCGMFAEARLRARNKDLQHGAANTLMILRIVGED